MSTGPGAVLRMLDGGIPTPSQKIRMIRAFFGFDTIAEAKAHGYSGTAGYDESIQEVFTKALVLEPVSNFVGLGDFAVVKSHVLKLQRITFNEIGNLAVQGHGLRPSSFWGATS
ncbi:hypothetical protein B0H13DRAFT_1851594 [Mycena leptocephala]|nr:hypothetical protein B0H13DRAFT_1851594 [Mycena leptocephala]